MPHDVLIEKYSSALARIGTKQAFGKRTPGGLHIPVLPDWQTRVGSDSKFEPVIQLAKWLDVPDGDCYLQIAHPDSPILGTFITADLAKEQLSININNCIHSWEFSNDIQLPLLRERFKDEVFPGLMWNMQWNKRQDIPNEVVLYLDHHPDLEFWPQREPVAEELAHELETAYGIISPPDTRYANWLEVAQAEIIRNAHVYGSYALTFGGRQHNHWGCGLFGHIWPPYLEDLDTGEQIKLSLVYSPTQKTLVVDMSPAISWAASRNGPFKLDPDYGYTTAGAAFRDMYTGYNYCFKHAVGTLGTTATLQSVSISCKDSGELGRWAVYDNADAGGFPDVLTGECAGTVTMDAAQGWKTSSCSGSLTDQIYFCAWKNNTSPSYVAFTDAGTSWGYGWDTNAWAAARPNPSAISSWTSGNLRASAYFTYGVNASATLGRLGGAGGGGGLSLTQRSVSAAVTANASASLSKQELSLTQQAVTASTTVNADATLSRQNLSLIPQPTNLCLNPNALDGGAWWTARATIDVDAINDPDGNPTADGIISSVDNNSHVVAQSSIFAADATYLIGAYAKKGGQDWFAFSLYGTNGAAAEVLNIDVFFNVNTGVVGSKNQWTGYIRNYGIVDVGGGWFYCWMTVEMPADISGGCDLYLCAVNQDGTLVYTGDGVTTEVYAWGIRVFVQQPITVTVDEAITLSKQVLGITAVSTDESISYSTTLTKQALTTSQRSVTITVSELIDISDQTVDLSQTALESGVSYALSMALASLSLAARAPTVRMDFGVAADIQALSLQQLSVGCQVFSSLSISRQTLSITQQSLTANISIPAQLNKDSLILSQQSVTDIVDSSVDIGRQTIALSQLGLSASISESESVTLSAQSLSLSQQPVSSHVSYASDLTRQSLSLGLNSLSVYISYSATIDKQDLTLAANAVTAHEGDTSTLNKQNFGIAQHSASITIDESITLDKQELALAQLVVSVREGEITYLTSQAISLSAYGIDTVVDESIDLSSQTMASSQNPVSVSIIESDSATLSKQDLTLSQLGAVTTSGDSIVLNKQNLSLTSQAIRVAETVVLDRQALSVSQSGASAESEHDAILDRQNQTLVIRSVTAYILGDVYLEKQSLTLTQRIIQAWLPITNLLRQALSLATRSASAVAFPVGRITDFTIKITSPFNLFIVRLGRQTVSLLQTGLSSIVNWPTNISRMNLALAALSTAVKVDIAKIINRLTKNLTQRGLDSATAEYGKVYGEEFPAAPLTGDIWDNWVITGTLNDAPDSGSYGDLLMAEAGDYAGEVEDTGIDGTVTLTLTADDNGGVTYYYRSNAAVFTRDAGAPAWTAYTIPVSVNRYVQVRAEVS